MKKKVWGKSILSDVSTQINEAVRSFTAEKERVIKKSLKKYCQKYGIAYQGLLDSGMLSSELHPNREVFLVNGHCIFYIKRTEKEFNNNSCLGTKVTYEFVEKF